MRSIAEPKPEPTHQHTQLAEQYSVGKFDEWINARNRAVTELYYTYGGVVTELLTGWTRPTIMKCVENANMAQQGLRKTPRQKKLEDNQRILNNMAEYRDFVKTVRLKSAAAKAKRLKGKNTP